MDGSTAEVHPDGSTTMPGEESFNSSEEGFFNQEEGGESVPPIVEEKPTDPALYLLAFLVAVGLYMFISWMMKKSRKKDAEEDFFMNLDGEKFNLQLPAAVDEYYVAKDKCEQAGWKPGAPAAAGQQPSPSQRVMAQALMKRALADIPLVQHIQKEAPGMNKLYSQSMCSVKQWRNYQAAEAMVSAEVEEVRAEADEIEPGWSQVIWRQAMQYHSMLKQKHENEMAHQAKLKAEQEKANAEAEKKRKEVEAAKQREVDAEKMAKKLMEEENKSQKTAGGKTFSGGSGMKKGFLDGGAKKKK